MRAAERTELLPGGFMVLVSGDDTLGPSAASAQMPHPDAPPRNGPTSIFAPERRAGERSSMSKVSWVLS